MEAVIIEPKTRRLRQLRLFPATNPLSERLGDPFFRALPKQPGVYFFYDETDRLLYIGQSNNLRARVGSYRHVSFERHARRTLRLVHRVRRIEWELCESPETAIERERELLLERRPPFNRAGVWQAPPWWLRMEVREEGIQLSLMREAVQIDGMLATVGLPTEENAAARFGPFRASFPFVYAALIRTALRRCRPGIRSPEFPAGYLNNRLVAPVHLGGGAFTQELIKVLSAFLIGQEDALLPLHGTAKVLGDDGDTFERQLREADEELLREFWERLRAQALKKGAADAPVRFTPRSPMTSAEEGDAQPEEATGAS